MKTPWSFMPPKMVRRLADTPVDELDVFSAKWHRDTGRPLTKEGSNFDGYTAPEAHSPAATTFHALGRWLKSKRRIITVSDAAQDLLMEWDLRFDDLPYVRERPERYGNVFRMDKHLMVYAEPLAGNDPGITYTIWVDVAGVGWSTLVHPITLPPMAWVNKTDDLLKKSFPEAFFKDDTGSVFAVDRKKLVHIALNAMAAMASDTRILQAGTRKAPRGNRKSRSGAVQGVRRFTLSADGAAMAVKKWHIVHPPPAAEKIKHKKHSTPELHPVEPHECKVWVNSPKLEEKVYNTRQRQRTKNGKTVTYFQYLVKRWRGRKDGKKGAYLRGGNLNTKLAAIVTGVDDIL